MTGIPSGKRTISQDMPPNIDPFAGTGVSGTPATPAPVQAPQAPAVTSPATPPPTTPVAPATTSTEPEKSVNTVNLPEIVLKSAKKAPKIQPTAEQKALVETASIPEIAGLIKEQDAYIDGSKNLPEKFQSIAGFDHKKGLSRSDFKVLEDLHHQVLPAKVAKNEVEEGRREKLRLLIDDFSNEYPKTGDQKLDAFLSQYSDQYVKKAFVLAAEYLFFHKGDQAKQAEAVSSINSIFNTIENLTPLPSLRDDTIYNYTDVQKAEFNSALALFRAQVASLADLVQTPDRENNKIRYRETPQSFEIDIFTVVSQEATPPPAVEAPEPIDHIATHLVDNAESNWTIEAGGYVRHYGPLGETSTGTPRTSSGADVSVTYRKPLDEQSFFFDWTTSLGVGASILHDPTDPNSRGLQKTIKDNTGAAATKPNQPTRLVPAGSQEKARVEVPLTSSINFVYRHEDWLEVLVGAQGRVDVAVAAANDLNYPSFGPFQLDPLSVGARFLWGPMAIETRFGATLQPTDGNAGLGFHGGVAIKFPIQGL